MLSWLLLKTSGSQKKLEERVCTVHPQSKLYIKAQTEMTSQQHQAGKQLINKEPEL